MQPRTNTSPPLASFTIYLPFGLNTFFALRWSLLPIEACRLLTVLTRNRVFAVTPTPGSPAAAAPLAR